MIRVRIGQISTTVLWLASLVVFHGCSPTEEPRQHIVTLDATEATRLADSIRQTVSVDIADGLELSLWAPEQLLADPIALAIDDQGRAWTTRTIRQKHSEFDIRGYPEWMIRSIGLKSVEERRAFLHETLSPETSDEHTWLEDLNGDSLHDWRDLAVEMERVYRIEDASGDGIADQSQLYIEDFHDEVTDIAGAVLPVGKDVYLGVAPDVWRLTDTSGDGMADEQTSISHGYGVHIGFSGHNISGLTMGPDGRLYWSIGDIGFSVVAPDGTKWDYPNQGGIFRSELDGSGFEVFAHGVRNTHEFVFDKYGNLISVDNDGDHAGEHERVVYLVNGSDSGWRSNWQYGKYVDPDNNGYKVWMDEDLHKPRFEGQAAYILPPIASYHAGPAGMAYSPGTALNDEWRDRFFVAEFTGSPARSHIYAFKLKPQGAGFAFDGEQVVTRGILTTGLDFGPDGALYVADWLDGWGTKDGGRIWKLDVPGGAETPARVETKKLLHENLSKRLGDGLLSLLEHADMRVRLKAQFELASRGDRSTLLAAAVQTDDQLARLHGLWGLGQLARRDAAAAEPIVALLTDSDPEIRAQAAKVLGDVRYEPATDALLPLLRDEAPRARFFATEALGRLAYRPAFGPIVSMLDANDDEDVYLRHGGAIALARIGDADALAELDQHPSRAVRIAAVVALRRLRDPGVAHFLKDADEYIVTEAARAINDDESIEAALPALAHVLVDRPNGNEALVRRALNANLRLGRKENAEAVVAYAASSTAPETLRAEAISILGVWPAPSVLDRVDGVYRGSETNDPETARAALAPISGSLLSSGSAAIKVAACGAVGRLELESAFPTLLALLRRDRSAEVRIAALEGLDAGGYDNLENALQIALADNDRQVRVAALELVTELQADPNRIAELLASVLDRGTMQEKQTAVAALGANGSEAARQLLSGLVDRLEAGTLDAALQLDVMEAVEEGGDSTQADRVRAHRIRPQADRNAAPLTGAAFLASYSETLEGGDLRRGRRIFNQHAAAQCIRCHAINDRGGSVGPSLTDVGSRLTRKQLLEALVDPGARIAPGFGNVQLTLKDSTTVVGMLQEEDATNMLVQTPDGLRRTIRHDEIANVSNAPSAMPPMGQILNRRELRDVIEFLSTQQGE